MVRGFLKFTYRPSHSFSLAFNGTVTEKLGDIIGPRYFIQKTRAQVIRIFTYAHLQLATLGYDICNT